MRELSREDGAKISVNRVAETAGVSIGSLYQYFPDKDALLSGLIARFVRRRFEAILRLVTELEEKERATGERIPLETVMDTLVRGTMAMNWSNVRLERALIAWFVRVGSLESLTEVDADATQKLAEALRRLGATPNRIRPVDPEVAAHVLIQSIRAVILTSLLADGARFDREAIARELVLLATRYLAP